MPLTVPFGGGWGVRPLGAHFHDYVCLFLSSCHILKFVVLRLCDRLVRVTVDANKVFVPLVVLFKALW